jgi:hypothetical protein
MLLGKKKHVLCNGFFYTHNIKKLKVPRFFFCEALIISCITLSLFHCIHKNWFLTLPEYLQLGHVVWILSFCHNHHIVTGFSTHDPKNSKFVICKVSSVWMIHSTQSVLNELCTSLQQKWDSDIKTNIFEQKHWVSIIYSRITVSFWVCEWVIISSSYARILVEKIIVFIVWHVECIGRWETHTKF